MLLLIRFYLHFTDKTSYRFIFSFFFQIFGNMISNSKEDILHFQIYTH